MERLRYVDVFRGLAILVMIFFHFIHTFAPVNVYADFPYFLNDLGLFTFPAPPFLFLFVSGMSSYLLVTRRRQDGVPTPAIAKNVAVKYGRYVLLSLPFAWIVFGPQTWFAWEEALQGIGLTIIVLALIYLYTDFDLPGGLAVMLAAAGLQANRVAIHEALVAVLPQVQNTLLVGVGELVWNATFGGYFAVTNLLPFAVGGLLMIKLVYEWEKPQRVLMLGVGLLLAAVGLVAAGYSLRFYARDLPLGFYGAGSATVIYYATYRLWQRYEASRVMDALAAFGRQAFLVYIWTWLLVIKGAEIAGLKGAFTHLQAYGVSAAITASVVVSTLTYARFRSVHGPLLPFAVQKLRQNTV